MRSWEETTGIACDVVSRCRFDELFDKYYKEVHPARLVFVSFLRSQHAEGQMVSDLVKRGYQPLQFKFHQ